MKKNQLLLILTLLLLIVGCKAEHSKKQDAPDYIKNLDSLMITSYERGLFNGNVLVAKNDTIVYQKSFGFTDGTQQTKLDNKSVFNIGSIAKEFNGVAIMMLQERGLLSINDTISKFNLKLPDWSKKVTIKHLLNYTSGITKIDPIEPPNDEEAWKIIRSVDTLLFDPGTDFAYDNTNVFLQRRIIENVTGQSFQKFITENVVKPLGLKSAIFDPSLSHLNRTSCYNWKNGPCPEIEFISGWLWQDITDLYKWINAMNSNTLISQKSFDTLLTNPYVKNKTGSIGEYFEKEQLQRHDGSSYRFKSVYLNDFKNNVIIILLANNGYNVIPTAHTIHNIMLGKPFKSIQQAIEKECLEDADLGIKAYYNLKSSNSAVEYKFDNPYGLNRLGYQLLKLDRTQDAIKIFQLMTSEFPNTADSFDCLGEAYLKNEQYNLALKNYKKAMALGGTNGNAKMMIKKINTILKNN